jgi:hypothetical protein
MPTRGAVSIETMLCLREHLDGYPNKLLTAFRKPVVEARNQLAKEARELDPNSLDFDPKYVLWVDDDAWWPSGHVDRAVSILEANPDVDMLSGLFCARQSNARPVAATAEDVQKGQCHYFPLKYECGELVPLIAGGAHWFIVRRAMLQTVGDAPFNRLTYKEAFPSYRAGQNPQMTEDVSFYARVNNAGGKIVIERSLLVAHIEAKTGKAYYPNLGPHKANGLEAPTPIDDADDEASKERTYFAGDGSKPNTLLGHSGRTRGSPSMLKFLGRMIDATAPGDTERLGALRDLYITTTGVTPEAALAAL